MAFVANQCVVPILAGQQVATQSTGDGVATLATREQVMGIGANKCNASCRTRSCSWTRSDVVSHILGALESAVATCRHENHRLDRVDIEFIAFSGFRRTCRLFRHRWVAL